MNKILEKKFNYGNNFIDFNYLKLSQQLPGSL